jgi:hypothetical protein
MNHRFHYTNAHGEKWFPPAAATTDITAFDLAQSATALETGKVIIARPTAILIDDRTMRAAELGM